MARSYASKKKDEIKAKERKQIESVTNLLARNNQTYEYNKKALEAQPKLIKANEEILAAETEKFQINSKMLEIELENMDFVNPIQKFHTLPDWKELFKKSKEFDKNQANKGFESAKLEFENKKKFVENFLFAFDKAVKIEDLTAQQARIEEQKPTLEAQLKELGAEIPGKEKAPDYIG